ncbi:MAG: NTP transferase domain-containing protein [Actinomycetota bacterium]
MSTAAVVLAAGRGARLGGEEPKPLVSWRGRPLVAWALDAALGGGCTPVVLVVGHDGEAVAASAPAGVRVVRSAHWADGISASLRVALDVLDKDPVVTAACIGLADQPRIGAEAYRRLVAAGEQGAEIAVATYTGHRQNPVLLARSVWAEARRLTGDEGARQLMRTRPVVEVDCTDTGDPTDVDTLGDLRSLDRAPDSSTEPRRRPEGDDMTGTT